MRLRIKRRFGSGALLLPQAGPFAESAGIAVSTLADETWGNLIAIVGSNQQPLGRFEPVTRKNVTLTGLRSFGKFSLFLWCNRLTITTGRLSASGQIGAPDGEGTSGGSGSSGGGAGGSNTTPQFGGNGGSGNDGQDTDFLDGGLGFAQNYLAGDTFPSYPVGGLGGSDFTGNSLGGSGSALSGGGGAGGKSTTSPGEFGGGGGGGAGSLTIFCNELVSLGATQPIIFSAVGGGGSNAEGSGSGGGGGGGGGGCVYIASKKYDGALTAGKLSVVGGLSGVGNFGTEFAQDGLPGEIGFYEITKSNTLVLRNYNDTWNNL